MNGAFDVTLGRVGHAVKPDPKVSVAIEIRQRHSKPTWRLNGGQRPLDAHYRHRPDGRRQPADRASLCGCVDGKR